MINGKRGLKVTVDKSKVIGLGEEEGLVWEVSGDER